MKNLIKEILNDTDAAIGCVAAVIILVVLAIAAFG